MAITLNRLNIEINKDVQDIITAVQGDTKSRFLDVSLFSNGTPINLTDHVARIYMVKPDDTEIFNVGDIKDAPNGRIQFELTSQALAVAGVLQTQIIIFDNQETEILSTNKFNIFITKSLISDNSIESSNEYGALVLLFQKLYEAIQGIKDINDKIGIPGTKGEELSTDTLFKELEYLIDFSEKNSVGSLGTKVDKLIEDTKVLKDNVPINWTSLNNVITKSITISQLTAEKVMTNISGTGSLILAVIEPTMISGGSIQIKIELDNALIFNVKFERPTTAEKKRFFMGIINDSHITRYTLNNKNNIMKWIDAYSLDTASNISVQIVYGKLIPLSNSLVTIRNEIDGGGTVYPIATAVVKNPIKFNNMLKITAIGSSAVESCQLKLIYSSGS